jgi:hypothetical protein
MADMSILDRDVALGLLRPRLQTIAEEDRHPGVLISS